MQEEVANRRPKRGSRLVAEQKRQRAKATAKKEAAVQQETMDAAAAEAEKEEDDEDGGSISLMYNTIRGYVSAINELWAHQVSRRLHNAPRPSGVAIKVLKSSVIRGRFQQARSEYTDRGVGTMRDGYLPGQIPDFSHLVWSMGMGGPKNIDQSHRTFVNFLFGNHKKIIIFIINI